MADRDIPDTSEPDNPPQLGRRAGGDDPDERGSGELGADGGGELKFPVVGVGASAGGLEAFEQLLRHLPPDPGMAVIFVQHLSPEHASNLTEILPRSTRMPVHEAADQMRIEPNHVYVIPPNRDLAVMHGVLHLMTRPQAPARHMPIDYLLRSLAEDQGSRAVGVVLSGTGSDGAAGLRTIKAEGGVTLAQDEASARYSGMPHAAAATGQVDLVLQPAEIAAELVRIVRHPHVRRVLDRGAEPSELGAPGTLSKLFMLVRQATGVDFSQYKQSTVERRIARRMVVHKLDSLEQYLKFLQRTPRELHALFDDMLINVTSFFREPEVFDALKAKVFPKIIEGKSPETPVRLWVPACSTGEEAYSLAIILLEYLSERGLHLPIQIFATDISEASIEKARHGHYVDNIAGDVSEARLRRYFVRSGDGYQISKAVRDVCVFARQNLAKDPPFSNIDLLSCRNLLIYLGPGLQKRVVPTLHYALKPGGYLLLGRSETIGAFADLFAPADREQKIYAKKGTMSRLPAEMGVPLSPDPQHRPEPPERGRPLEARDLVGEARQVLLNRFAPPGVVVNKEMDILHFLGQTGRFLEPSPGDPSFNLLRMARPGLAIDLRTAIHEVRREHRRVRKEGIATMTNGGSITVNVEVHPLGRQHANDPHFLVLFDEVAMSPGLSREEGEQESRGAPAAAEAETELDRLHHELDQTKATLKSIIEEHETTNEELRAANEEIQSANEELQSTNEELETAKEELQSTNEELVTLNAELENQNDEANRAIDDFNNLHRAVNIPVILLDRELRIRSFTPPCGEAIGRSSLGRGPEDLRAQLGHPSREPGGEDPRRPPQLEHLCRGSAGRKRRLVFAPHPALPDQRRADHRGRTRARRRHRVPPRQGSGPQRAGPGRRYRGGGPPGAARARRRPPRDDGQPRLFPAVSDSPWRGGRALDLRNRRWSMGQRGAQAPPGRDHSREHPLRGLPDRLRIPRDRTQAAGSRRLPHRTRGRPPIPDPVGPHGSPRPLTTAPGMACLSVPDWRKGPETTHG